MSLSDDRTETPAAIVADLRAMLVELRRRRELRHPKVHS